MYDRLVVAVEPVDRWAASVCLAYKALRESYMVLSLICSLYQTTDEHMDWQAVSSGGDVSFPTTWTIVDLSRIDDNIQTIAQTGEVRNVEAACTASWNGQI